MNIFCFTTITRQKTYYVAANSVDDGVNILNRLGISVRAADYVESAATFCINSEPVAESTGQFRYYGGGAGYGPIRCSLINDNGKIV